MASNTTNEDLIGLLTDVADKTNRYFSIFVYLFGVIGNILNITALFKKTLRTNPCSWLFLISSIANLIAIIAGLTTRSLSGWAADPTATNSALCKVRAYVLLVSRTFAIWTIVLAVIDRWLTSCLVSDYRRLSSLKNARRQATITFIITALLYVHLFYCYDSSMVNTPLSCYHRSSSCQLGTDIITFCTLMVFPMIINCTFGLLTISNVQRSLTRVAPVNNNLVSSMLQATRTNPAGSSITATTGRMKKKNDRDLLLMLFVQVLLLTLFNLPIVLQKIYALLRPRKTPLEAAIDLLFYNIAVVLAYVTNGMPFYIYTLSGGRLFRKALREIFCMKRE